jgi:SAM-dependent methyltransferase
VVKAVSRRSLKGETAAIKASLTNVDLQPLVQRYAGVFYAKYFDLDRWIPYNVRILRELNLFDAKPITALDIGCGGGLLLYCLQYYGHQAVGIDIPDPLFSDLAAALGVNRRISPVKPLQPLSFPGRFDLITVVSPGFDCVRSPVWGIRQWRYFLDDVCGRLNGGGRLYLRLNHARPPALHDALSRGFAPPSKHLEDKREFIFDHESLRHVLDDLR